MGFRKDFYGVVRLLPTSMKVDGMLMVKVSALLTAVQEVRERSQEK